MLNLFFLHDSKRKKIHLKDCKISFLKNVRVIFKGGEKETKKLQIGFTIKSCTKWHIIEGTGTGAWTFVWRHSLDAVFSLVWWQFTSQFIGKNIWLKIEKSEMWKNFHLEKFHKKILKDEKIVGGWKTCKLNSYKRFFKAFLKLSQWIDIKLF